MSSGSDSGSDSDSNAIVKTYFTKTYTYVRASLDTLLPGAAVRTSDSEGHVYHSTVVGIWANAIKLQRKIRTATETWSVDVDDMHKHDMHVCTHRILNETRKRVVYNIPTEETEHKVIIMCTETGRFRTRIVGDATMIRGPRVAVDGVSAARDWIIAEDGTTLDVGRDTVGFVNVLQTPEQNAADAILAMAAQKPTTDLSNREKAVTEREKAVAERERIVAEREKELADREAAHARAVAYRAHLAAVALSEEIEEFNAATKKRRL